MLFYSWRIFYRFACDAWRYTNLFWFVWFDWSSVSTALLTRDIDIAILSVRLSVRLSRSGIASKLLNISSAYGSPVYFLVLDIFAKFRRGHLVRRCWIQIGYINFTMLDQYLAICRKQYKIGHSYYGEVIGILCAVSNREIPMTLSDLSRSFPWPIYRCYFVCLVDARSVSDS